MPRPRLYTDEIWLRIYSLIQAHPRWGHVKVTEELGKQLGTEAPSARTVSRIMGEVKRSVSRFHELEDPWRAWDERDTELRPANRYLLRIAGQVQSLEMFQVGGAIGEHLMLKLWHTAHQQEPRESPRVPVPELTRLEAMWVWRIHEGAPELSDFDVFWTAQDIVARDRVHRILSPNDDFDDSDIHFLLALKPWSDVSSYVRYLRLVRSDRIPPYRLTPFADLHQALPSVPVNTISRIESKANLLLHPRGDYSLESMFVERRCRVLDHIRQRALRNDFGFTKTWEGRSRLRITTVKGSA